MSDFIYPYNYVPSAGLRRPDKKGEIGSDLPYQNLSSYLDEDGTLRCSGRIRYCLTALSPLFIPDPEQTSCYHIGPEADDFHRVMDFFNVDGYLAIPNTSLQGMCRSVVEAISNSAFGVFTPSKKLHAFRKLKNISRDVKDVTDRKWGRWVIGNNGRSMIEPLEAVKIERAAFDSAFQLADDVACASLYNTMRRQPYTLAMVEVWQLHTGNKHVREFSLTYDGVEVVGTVFEDTMSDVLTGSLELRAEQNGPMLKTQVQGVIGQGATGPVIKGPLIGHLKKVGSVASSLRISNPNAGPWRVDYRTVSGVPNAITGSNEERVCWLRQGDNVWAAKKATQHAILWPRAGWEDLKPPQPPQPPQRAKCHYVTGLLPQSGRIPVSDAAIENFRSVNALADGSPGTALPEQGEIVRYYSVRDDKGAESVLEFGRQGFFKTAEQASIADLADVTPETQPERKNTALSPASRLFGWSVDSPSDLREIPEEDESPIAGRVSFGVAWSDSTTAVTQLKPLPILSSPKPGYYPYTLRPVDNTKNPSVEPAYFIKGETRAGWWETPGKLRGRKFYLHHPVAIYDPTDKFPPSCAPSSPEEACQRVAMKDSVITESRPLRSNQNSTVALLPPGATFQGAVEFDGLADYEIGMLLWGLSLADSPLSPSAKDRKRAHKLGMGRPLGLGTVRVEVLDLALWDPVAGWRDASLPTETPVTDPAEAECLIRKFKTWMLTGYSQDNPARAREFDELPFFKDICLILRTNLAGETSVQYPPDPQYFVAERKKRPDHQANKPQKEQPLQTPMALSLGCRQKGDFKSGDME